MQWFRRPTAHAIAFFAFLAFYLVLVQDVRHWSYRDPSSVFFDPRRAFARAYSELREIEAEAFIRYHNDPAGSHYAKATQDPSFCVGIATVQREGARTFRRTVGSVLAGLTGEERKDIFLMSFFANSDPSVHPAYNESWVPVLSDKVLTYDDAVSPIGAYASKFEHTDVHSEKKPLFDYVHLLRHCYDTGARYIIMLEDDVIAADGWYFRTKSALKALEKRPAFDNTLYVRLFYDETILGWNTENRFTYLVWCISVEAALVALLYAVPRLFPPAKAALTPLTIATICFILAPMCIGLYFAAGRLTVSPLPTGLNRMDTYGCCSQAIVFPRDQIPELMAHYDNNIGHGLIDELTEEYANDKQLARWALTPSVFAHIGTTSSEYNFKPSWGRNNTENIWNFSFELFDAEMLKNEH